MFLSPGVLYFQDSWCPRPYVTKFWSPMFPWPYVATFESSLFPKPKVPRARCFHFLEPYVPKTQSSQGPMFPNSRVLSSQDPMFPGSYVSTFWGPMVPIPKVPQAPCSQVLGSHVPMTLCSQGPVCQVLGSPLPKTLCCKGPMLPSSRIRSQLGISDWEQTRYTCLNLTLILTFILSPSVLAFPPNQSLVSLPASSLPPPSILVFILASQSGQTGWLLALQSIIIVVFDTYNLRQNKHSLCVTLLFFIRPPLPPFFISIGHLFFFLSGCQMLASSTFAPNPLPLPALAESTLHLSIHFYLPSLHPCPEIDKHFTFI